MPPGGLYTGDARPVHPESNAAWRISPEPFGITPKEYEWFEALGSHLLHFYRACNLLYSQSSRGIQPAWVAEVLDRGKDADVIAYARMNRFKSQLPLVLRPDVIPTDEGMVITELDSVPGGIGFTGFLSRLYAQFSDGIVGGSEGMICGFAEMARALSGKPHPNTAIVVSDEADDYRAEMLWLAEALRRVCLPAVTLQPRDVRFDDEAGLFAELDGERRVFDVLYRFFELFDLPNIPKAELMLYAAKKRQVQMTPPPKAYLEEKMNFALLHHPALEPFWKENLPAATRSLLLKSFPRTWIVDATPVPPHATIPGLTHRGVAVQDFRQFADATQKEREFVLKPSGYSALAWGSRGVVVGHDVPQETWRDALTNALDRFPKSPHILQEFHKGRRCRVSYYDFDRKRVVAMDGRARLTPYYFLVNEKAKLGGILATVCPADKKVLHGMVDSVMMPCAVSHSS
jgi:hypothetical protein